jgi:two-component system, chemotaxis family, sensor kinase CheA
MNREQLQQRLMNTFALEMEEHLQTIVGALTCLSESLNDSTDNEYSQHLNHIFRAVHSLKGAARSVNVQDIEEHCHHLENVLVAIQSSHRKPTEAQLQKLYQELLWLQHNSTLPATTEAPQLSQRSAETLSHSEYKAPQAKPAGPRQPHNSVRLPAERLDRFLNLVSEVNLVSRSGKQILEEIDELASLCQQSSSNSLTCPTHHHIQPSFKDKDISNQPLLNTSHAYRKTEDKQNPELSNLLRSLRKNMAKFLLELELAVEPLEQEIHLSRLQPFKYACEQVSAFVNSQKSNGAKNIRLQLEGQDVSLDRALIEGLKPVLMHLTSNALDHGIESPQKRSQQGKPEIATLLIKAQRINGYITITVNDDGKGVDETKLKEALHAKNLDIPQDKSTLLKSLFEAGISTASAVSMTSGRGVGLDAVRSAILDLRGNIAIYSQSGKGVKFEIQLPQTLSAYEVLVLEIGETLYAIDASLIKFTRKLNGDEFIQNEHETFITIDDINYPLGNLETHLGVFSQHAHYAVIITDGIVEKAFLADQLIGLEAVLVKDLASVLGTVTGISGGATLSDGSIVIILDPATLLKQAEYSKTSFVAHAAASDQASALTILVVEDSLTTRMLEINVLETQGYKVLEAIDGQQGWEILRDNHVDLVISDVDMPRLNGFELTRRIRDSAKWSHVPVILLTARYNNEDKLEGLSAGANLYMKKQSFDQAELLNAVQRLTQS